jgi:hypothetical protein
VQLGGMHYKHKTISSQRLCDYNKIEKPVLKLRLYSQIFQNSLKLVEQLPLFEITINHKNNESFVL